MELIPYLLKHTTTNTTMQKLFLLTGKPVASRFEYVDTVSAILMKLSTEYITRYIVLSRDNGRLCISAVLDVGFLKHLPIKCMSMVQITDDDIAKVVEGLDSRNEVVTDVSTKLACGISQEDHESLTHEEVLILGLEGLETVTFAR